MLSNSTVIGLTVGGIILLLMLFMFSGVFTTLVLLLILGAIVFFGLSYFKVIKVSTNDKNQVSVNLFETPPAPNSSNQSTEEVVANKEVFYVAGNNYTYNEAPALCAAYEAELATYDQVMETYNRGGEWCGYGWTAGGMALFPTQKATWDKLQQEVEISKRTACGRPGVNGGYFDPATKYGVNCYGLKPGDNGTHKYPLPIPGKDMTEFNKMVDAFKSNIAKMIVSPFNNNVWSVYNNK